ncbi:MAG: hypothetical protein ABI977_08410, partial [Acidobacteriota bacterium]
SPRHSLHCFKTMRLSGGEAHGDMNDPQKMINRRLACLVCWKLSLTLLIKTVHVPERDFL